MEFISGCLRKYKGQLPTGGALALHPLCSMYSRNLLEGFFETHILPSGKYDAVNNPAGFLCSTHTCF